jgi:hypothetical protein
MPKPDLFLCAWHTNVSHTYRMGVLYVFATYLTQRYLHSTQLQSKLEIAAVGEGIDGWQF